MKNQYFALLYKRSVVEWSSSNTSVYYSYYYDDYDPYVDYVRIIMNALYKKFLTKYKNKRFSHKSIDIIRIKS